MTKQELYEQIEFLRQEIRYAMQENDAAEAECLHKELDELWKQYDCA